MLCNFNRGPDGMVSGSVRQDLPIPLKICQVRGRRTIDSINIRAFPGCVLGISGRHK